MQQILQTPQMLTLPYCGCQEDLTEERNYVLTFLTLEARFIHAVKVVAMKRYHYFGDF